MTRTLSAAEWREAHGLSDVFAPVPVLRAKYRNKFEALFAEQVIAPKVLRGAVTAWGYEDVTLRMGFDLRYTPDFWCFENCALVFYECKGLRRAAGMVKIRAAAAKFQWATFILAENKRSVWTMTEIKAG